MLNDAGITFRQTIQFEQLCIFSRPSLVGEIPDNTFVLGMASDNRNDSDSGCRISQVCPRHLTIDFINL